ncbi:hypothetical protein J2N86_04295 [Legionella lytica]|uniref:Uncharacterized protein n=1 Tax=Legionella lytica TaxID=96232 RepID=A0ABY4YAZ2_9GAMM|nr:hypothetical protein [Legionella lytica]USQ14543.1 hypothetical protein J2N86_04295 [Legionella lytica]
MTIKSSLFRVGKVEPAKPYQRQLADKKNHLLAAKQCLKESTQLIQHYRELIALKEQELAQLNVQIAHEYEQQLLREKQAQLLRFISEAPVKLAPYLLRCEQLQADIELFEAHIRELIKKIQDKRALKLMATAP